MNANHDNLTEKAVLISLLKYLLLLYFRPICISQFIIYINEQINLPVIYIYILTTFLNKGHLFKEKFNYQKRTVNGSV